MVDGKNDKSEKNNNFYPPFMKYRRGGKEKDETD